MEKNVQLLTIAQEEYKICFTNYKTMKSLYDRNVEITSDETYKIRREITKKMSNAQNDLIVAKSKLSKYINSLLYDHNCASGKHNKLTVEELYTIVTAYENNDFQNNYFPKNRLKAINKNNIQKNKAILDLETANAIINGKYKLFNW